MISAIYKHLTSDLHDLEPSLFQDGTTPLERKMVEINGHSILYVIGEFWTSGQRKAASIHEVSYRACFKPQLPAYFIRRFTSEGDTVYDPFSGRGTTPIEAALWGRNIIANDANPLSAVLTKPRLDVPTISEIEDRLKIIPYNISLRSDIDLSMFYHRKTEGELVSLRNYLFHKKTIENEDRVDAWIRMIATNRLTGHSPGFFSVYTFPPNQAVSQESQIKINQKRRQIPEYRDTKAIIYKKSLQLLKGLTPNQISKLHNASVSSMFLTGDARKTSSIRSGSVQLTVTSPPFLDIVQYADDNWLRCWFNALDTKEIANHITVSRTIEQWCVVMRGVFQELHRITQKGGLVAFEVGEIRKGKIKLEESIVPIGIDVGFVCEAVLINQQDFTKTANIWGISNNTAGTNTNRIALFHKP